ncbi:ABC transporter ATP-binding protein [Curtobacterium sp. MCBA15_008]|uniref:ABC transporter ATP-binding protein n=1 Tax=Curtobacterium sp. MCBA15_008 TaxID=1898736 RepID=UPI002677088E|nr:ABC transporter ATP-binding protein [Curtobacterium sp. MCBA15_008]
MSASGVSTPVLRHVSLTVRRGEMVAVVGPSGSGKTTLLTCLSGLERPSGGTVEVDGISLATLSAQRLARFRRGRIGFVFQDYNLIPALSVRENIALPARVAHRPVSREEIDAALESVGLLQYRDKYPGTLSGGQQQRVAIARVLVSAPGLVFADEPTGALDTVSGSAVLDLLRSTATGDQSVVMVTHDLQAAARADRVLVLRDGVIHNELLAPEPEAVLAAVEAAALPS